MNIIWHNGEFKEDGPLLRPSDRMRLGDGVFDTMLMVEGRPAFAQEHFQRLLDHAAALNINVAYKIKDLEDALNNLIAHNKAQQKQATISTTVSRGPAERGLIIPEQSKPQMIMRICNAPAHMEHIRLVVAQSTRRNEGSPLCRIKSFNYGDNILAMSEAQNAEADDAIMLNNAGHIACTTMGNVFICEAQTLITPPLNDGAMNGIIRTKILQHFDTKERSITPNDLMNADGVYITNSVRGALPVSQINGRKTPPPKIQIDREFHFG